MLRSTKRAGTLVGVLLAFATAVTHAGGFGGGHLSGILHPSSGCACNRSPAPVHAAPVHFAPVIHSACHCGHAAASCCGVGGGALMFAGGMPGIEYSYGDGGSMYGSSFLSGYEGLPNMDGGGVHHRYPYHSYRRPWAHPGPASANISIVW